MTKSSIRNTTLAISLALLCSVPSLSSAAYEKFKVQVSYSDLNLESDAGVAALYQRLKSASARACGSSEYRRAGSLKAAQFAKTCRADVLTDLVEKVDNEKLSAIHKG